MFDLLHGKLVKDEKRILIGSLCVPNLQYRPLRWSARDLVSVANCSFKSKGKQFAVK